MGGNEAGGAAGKGSKSLKEPAGAAQTPKIPPGPPKFHLGQPKSDLEVLRPPWQTLLPDLLSPRPLRGTWEHHKLSVTFYSSVHKSGNMVPVPWAAGDGSHHWDEQGLLLPWLVSWSVGHSVTCPGSLRPPASPSSSRSPWPRCGSASSGAPGHTEFTCQHLWGGSGTPQTPSFSPRPHLGVLQDVVDKHHSAPGVQQLLHVGVEVQSHFLVLVDAAELWGGVWVWGEPPEPPDA